MSDEKQPIEKLSVIPCTKCDQGGMPLWFNPDRLRAIGSCIWCGHKVEIPLIPWGHVITKDGIKKQK